MSKLARLKYWWWKTRIDLRYWWRWRVIYPLAVAYNWCQGCRFFMTKDEHGEYLDFTEKCCPYPLRFDWSARACIKAGDCGCIKGCTERQSR